MILPNDVLSRMVCSNFEPLGEPIRKTSVYVIISEYFIGRTILESKVEFESRTEKSDFD